MKRVMAIKKHSTKNEFMYNAIVKTPILSPTVITALVAAFFLGIYLYFGAVFIRSSSATYDEPVHLASGYSYLKTGQFRLNIMDHPPLAEMWAALPLLWLRPNLYTQLPDWIEGRVYHYSDYFLYHNRVDPEIMLNAARRFSLFSWGLLLALGILAWSWRLGGQVALVGSALTLAFCPALISNLSLVTTDGASAVLFFLTFWILSATKSRSFLRWIVAGISAGLAHASKFNMILILPIAGSVAALDWYLDRPRSRFPVAGLILFAAAGMVAVAAVYLFGQFPLYWRGLSATLHRLDEGRSSYFLGRHSTTGSILYFPVALLIKMPLATLCFAAAGIAAFIKDASTRLSEQDRGDGGTKRFSAYEVLWLLLPPLIYLFAAMSAKVQIGYRHILPVVPFIVVWAGLGIGWLWRWRWGKLTVGILSVWLGASVWRVQPYDLAYFNEITGGPSQGYRYLTDSNVDWGQGLKELGLGLKSMGNPPIYLSYFGTADPSAYGIAYAPVGFVSNVERAGTVVDPSISGKVLFAISATNLQCTYYANKSLFDWLKDRTPAKIIGYSIFLYDLTGDSAADRNLARLLGSAGQPAAAAALLSRIK